MTNQAAIQKQLQDEYDKFYNSYYKGNISIPVNILEIFKVGVMELAPHSHKLNMQRIKVIAYKNLEELTYGDLKDVITIILNTPLKFRYDRFEDAINGEIQLHKFILSYNNNIDDFEKKLKMKQATLNDISRGVNGNGLSIVN